MDYQNLSKQYGENEDPEKRKNIKNKHYRRFLDEGIIEVLSEDDIKTVLENLKTKHMREARSLIIALYYTGARPNEILRLRARHIKRKGRHVILQVKGSKRGLPRSVYLSRKKELVMELLDFAESVYPERYLFYHFRGRYVRKKKVKGQIVERVEYGAKLRKHFYKWFSVLPKGTIPPYFLRHNRFSSLAQKGATMEEMRMLKGSKTFASVEPYLHMSEATAKKLAKRIE